MAKNDFSRPVSVHGKDELAELGGAFNAMSEQIGQQVATLHRYAEIDRIVLTTLDVDAVIERALSGILSLTEVSSVAIILRGDDKRPLRRYFCSHDNDSLVAQDVVDETALPCWVHGRRWIERERLQSPALWSWAGNERMLCCRDIEHPSHRVGLLILAHPTERQFSDAVEKQIAGLLDRVAIALSATEREQRLVQQARYDSLTGLPNRHYFLETLDAAMGASAGGVQRGVLLFLDLDHFKRANDVLGHLAGDALLKMAAQRMQQVIHAPHVLARLGGDEFTILYRGCAAGPEATEDAGGIDAADIDKLTNALIDSLNQPFYLEGRSVFVSLSIGSARFPEDGTSALDLLRRADTAMYHAKKAGRQRHVAFQPPMEKDFQESLALDQSIRDALIGEQLQLFLQVQVDARSGAPVGAEALIRWFGADDSVRGPQEWLAHAENSNLINEVGAWVLTRACQQLRRADQQGCRIARIAVNVSAKQLSNEHFYEDVTRALAAAGISPHRLELEITESQLMASPELSVAMLRRLTSLGIALAVDDFGTGYSSFSQLRLLPLSVLKIDRSFICDIDASEDARAVVLAIIQMAHALRLTVVAEGVENAAQQAVLIELGCDAIQGYFTGRPVPEEQFLERHGNGLDPKTAGPPAVRLIAP